MTTSSDFHSKISRARDKLANDLIAFHAQSRTGVGDRPIFNAASAVAHSVEHLVRVILDETDGDKAPRDRSRRSAPLADEAIKQGVKHGLRRARKFLDDLEGSL